MFPSNRITNFGVVLDALNSPQPLSKFILNPSIVIFSPFKLHFAEKSSIILLISLYDELESLWSEASIHTLVIGVINDEQRSVSIDH